MWQGMLTYKDGDEDGLTIMMETMIGMPGPDRRAVKREALQYLELAEKCRSRDQALGIRICHSAYESRNDSAQSMVLAFK